MATQASTNRPRKLTARRNSQTKKIVRLPSAENSIDHQVDGRTVRLTNLRKIFWPKQKISKRDLLQFYYDVAPYLLPHLAGRAMVMKRYPNGIAGDFFFMKRAPAPRPQWIETCSIEHSSGSVIDFPIINDVASLLWVINLGCIDLNPWYARCDDFERPDYLHFDLDPVNGADWSQMIEAAVLVHESLTKLQLPSYIKTTGSRGFHIYVPITRGPTQKEVWALAKQFATSLAALRPDLLTA
jgi:bifunctional non-homologous end joining protein LigD